MYVPRKVGKQHTRKKKNNTKAESHFLAVFLPRFPFSFFLSFFIKFFLWVCIGVLASSPNFSHRITSDDLRRCIQNSPGKPIENRSTFSLGVASCRSLPLSLSIFIDIQAKKVLRSSAKCARGKEILFCVRHERFSPDFHISPGTLISLHPFLSLARFFALSLSVHPSLVLLFTLASLFISRHQQHAFCSPSILFHRGRPNFSDRSICGCANPLTHTRECVRKPRNHGSSLESCFNPFF